MKILHVNTYDRGGAAKACIRLHESLVQSGFDSKLLLLYSTGVSIRNAYHFSAKKAKKSRVERLISKMKRFFYSDSTGEHKLKAEIKKLIPHTIEWFSFPDSGFDLTAHPLYKQADIIHLHWVADFIDYSFFKKNKKPVVWTLHDMNPFTGGCHYAGNSKGYQGKCLNCPQLQETDNPDYSALILRYKKRYINSAKNMSIVTPSIWLGEESRSSTSFSVLKHYVISYGIDSNLYHPVDKNSAREKLGLPVNKKIILFVSDSLQTYRKGFAYLLDALHKLDNKEEFVLCMLGADNEKQKNEIGFTTYALGYVHDEEIIRNAYSAADVFVIPSLMDNFPNTVLESLLCGTPVIGFPVGGIKDMIKHGKNGLLCEELTVASLSRTIRHFFNDISAFNPSFIRKDAIERYDSKVQVGNYLNLYRKISAL